MFVAAVALMLGAETAEIERRIDRGEIVVETAMVANHDDRVIANGFMEIDASLPQVWSAILDFPARVEENWMVEDVSVYHDATRKQVVNRCARWDLRVMGVDIRYHTTYRGDLATGHLTWALDELRSNDLKFASGTYRVSRDPDDADRSRLHYTFVVASKHKLTPWLRRKLTLREVRRLLDRIRKRAQNGV